MQPTIDLPIFQAILDNPNDQFLKLVYADKLEERGETERSKIWRWIGNNRKYPVFGQHPHRETLLRNTWDWFVQGGGLTAERVFPHAVVRVSIYEKLVWTESGRCRGSYYTQAEAYFDLVQVLIEYPSFMVEYPIFIEEV